MSWNRQTISARQAAIKAELDVYSESHGIPARLQYCLEQTRELEASIAQDGQLDRYIYVMSALVHHIRHGGLRTSQIANLAALAKAILQAENIQANVSKIGYLYGDIHLALSQIHWQEGRHQPAAWEQQLGQYYQGRDRKQDGFLRYTAARRALRLGQGVVAANQFALALEGDLAAAHRPSAMLERAKALRLAGRHEEANQALADAPELASNAHFQSELAWERLCLEATLDKSPQLLLAATAKNGSHHRTVYALEAWLWTCAHASKESLVSSPSVRRLTQISPFKPRYKTLVQAAETLEFCYDKNISFSIRLDRLSSLLGNLGKLIAVEFELLVLAAGGRWLARNRHQELSGYVLGQYRTLSLSLSDGHSGDVIGVVSDLMDASWFQGEYRRLQKCDF